jgi:hypothetical protein
MLTMDFEGVAERPIADLRELTRGWGARKKVSLYLDRCQVDTPSSLVAATWKHVRSLRKDLSLVLDFGAGDGRFARGGTYASYVGYEIDRSRSTGIFLPPKAIIHNQCAFSENITSADLCIGNPPFVRNQDLPIGWRQRVSGLLRERTGVNLSGLSNAWQYFFLLSLASTKNDGLVALVIPYEWVSRPAARTLRDYIVQQKWNVSVYRLVDTTFDSVLTTSSITIVDKSTQDACWKYFEENAKGMYVPLSSPSGAAKGTIPYLSRSKVGKKGAHATRGVSPGTQKVLTLTEGERVRSGLQIGRDVVACVTTLRVLPPNIKKLDQRSFRTFYQSTGQKCWLIRTDRDPLKSLRTYLSAVPEEEYQTSTCLEREDWWRFKMPPIPAVLMSMSFQGRFPKGVENCLGARAVGGVCGIYNVGRQRIKQITDGFDGIDIRKRIVAHSNGLRKIEINQLNALFSEIFGDSSNR